MRRRRAEEGALFFEDGELVHARAGSLEGEDAVYHLLQWTEGAFHLSDQPRIPRRTVHTSWHYLVLEGMKKVDEEQVGMGAAAPPMTLTPQQTAADEQLELQIINLLSQMEFARAKIASKKMRKRPSAALQNLAEMVNILAPFLEGNAPGNSHSLEKIIALSADSYPAIRLLRVHNNRLQPGVIVTLYQNWSASRADRNKMFTEMARGIVDIIESCFAYITSSFHSPATADQWRDTCLLFLAELTTVLQKVRF